MQSPTSMTEKDSYLHVLVNHIYMYSPISMIVGKIPICKHFPIECSIVPNNMFLVDYTPVV